MEVPDLFVKRKERGFRMLRDVSWEEIKEAEAHGEEEKVMKEEKLLDEWERKAGNSKVVVLHIVKRSSEGYYNYKTDGLLIWYPSSQGSYEEADVKDLVVSTVYCGVYQEYSCGLLKEAAERRGWHIVEF